MTAPIIQNGTFTLDSLKAFAEGADKNAKVLVNQDTGTVSIKGAITSRLLGTKGARLEAAHLFLETIKKEYGETIANELAKEADVASLKDGKPLSARRIQNVLARAEKRLQQLEGRIHEAEHLMHEVAIETRVKKFGEQDGEKISLKTFFPEIENAAEMVADLKAILASRDAKLSVDVKTLRGDLPESFQSVAKREANDILTRLGIDHLFKAEDMQSLINDTHAQLKTHLPLKGSVSPYQYAQCLREHPEALMTPLLTHFLGEKFPALGDKLPSVIDTIRTNNPALEGEVRGCKLPSKFKALLNTVHTAVTTYVQDHEALSAKFEELQAKHQELKADHAKFMRTVMGELVDSVLSSENLTPSTRAMVKHFLTLGRAENPNVDPVELAHTLQDTVRSLHSEIKSTPGLDPAQKAKAFNTALCVFSQNYQSAKCNPERAQLIFASALSVGLQTAGLISGKASPLPMLADAKHLSEKGRFQTEESGIKSLHGGKRYFFSGFIKEMYKCMTNPNGPINENSQFSKDVNRSTIYLPDGTLLSKKLSEAMDQLTDFATHGAIKEFSALDEQGKKKMTVLSAMLCQQTLTTPTFIGSTDGIDSDSFPIYINTSTDMDPRGTSFYLSFDENNTLHLSASEFSGKPIEMKFFHQHLDATAGVFLDRGIQVSISESALENIANLPWENAHLGENHPISTHDFDNVFMPNCPKEIQDFYEEMPGFELQAFNTFEYHADAGSSSEEIFF